MFVQNIGFQKFFDSVSSVLKEKELIKLATNYVTSDLAGLIKKYGTSGVGATNTSPTAGDEKQEVKVSVQQFADIITMIQAGDLSSRGAKDLLAMLFFAYFDITVSDTPLNAKDSIAPLSRISRQDIVGKASREIAEAHGLIQKNDPEALNKMISELVTAHPQVVADYKSGKEAALMFFVGQIMKASKGSVNPAMAKEAVIAFVQKIG
jgi:Asp-tRNA(Asn)/Glu-tRNA(Gln) amidotransferase B subunit